MFTHDFVNPPELTCETLENGLRYYVTPSGARYESATTFIHRHWDNSFLEKWKKRVGEAKAASISNGATKRGKALHTCVERYLSNDESYRAGFSHLPTKALFVQIKPLLARISKIRLIEKALYSDELKVAGTPDIMADFDEIPSTIDLKSSTRDKKEEYITTYWLQCAMYTTMFYERFKIMNEQSVIIMAVAEDPAPILFMEPTYKSLQRLQDFIEDPIKFQSNLS